MFSVVLAAALPAPLLLQPARAQPAGAPALVVEALPSPSTGDASAPQLTARGDRVILSWLERSGMGAALRFAERTATGWSKPTVVVTGQHLVSNWADVPSVRSLADGSLVAHWLEAGGGDHEAYDIRIASSADGGRTWSAPITPHRDGTRTQHGFASFFDMPGGGLGLVWLDGRETAGGAGPMTLRARRTLAARTGAEDLVAARVCECCPTAAATTAEGPIVAFRGRTAGEIRDIQVARLAGGAWTTPVAVHDDGWKIDGCPINGPALAARGRSVAVAWFTAAGGQGRAYVAFSTDAGRTFGAPVRVDDEGTTGRVQVALLPDGAAAVSWIGFAQGMSQLMVRLVRPGGARSAPARIAAGIGTQSPRMAAGGGELAFAWTGNSRGIVRVYTARVKL